MSVNFGPLRRAAAYGLLATATISAGGCFQVEEVADPSGAAESTSEGDPQLDIAMGEEAGPLDLNVDATLGEVSPADFARPGFAPANEVPEVPSSFAASPPADPSFAPRTAPPLASFAKAPAEPAPSAAEFSPSAPALANSFEAASPALQPSTPAPAPPALAPSFEPSSEFASETGQFPPPAGEAGGGLAALPDQESAPPVEPMQDPESPAPNGELAAGELTSSAPGEFAETTELEPNEVPLAESPATEASDAAAELLPRNESGPSENFAAPPTTALVESDSEPAIEVEEDVTEEATSPPLSFAPPALSAEAGGSETLPEASTPETEASPANENVAASPFEEDDFAPRFGPGRHLAQTSPVSDGPATIPTPGPALGPDEVEGQTPSVLAQESPSPAADALAMQIVDPSAPPPASLRPTAQPNAALPAFDPTAGDRLNPPVVGDDEGYTPTPPGEAPATGAAPAPGPATPRAIPMPGPAREDESGEAVPAPPATSRPSGEGARSAASTPAEIAEASRNWTDASGTHTLEAAILEYDKGEVRLETPKGERFVVSLSSLSRYDQGYVKGLAEGTLGKDAADRTWTDSSGAFSIDGRFSEVDGDAVRIAREDGKTFRIEKRELGPYDRGYVDGLADAEQK